MFQTKRQKLVRMACIYLEHQLDDDSPELFAHMFGELMRSGLQISMEDLLEEARVVRMRESYQ